MTSLKVQSSLLSRLLSVPAKCPFAFGVVLSGCKTSFSDLLVQKVVEQRKEIDWRRNLAFASFGFFYLGGVQYAIYVPIFGRIFPRASAFAAKSIKDKIKDAKGTMAMLGQVFLDQCVHHPLMYFPAFYCTKELVMSEKPDIMNALNNYRKNMSEDLLALWKVWVPATLINFSFMPMYARIPFVAGVSLLWTCILSTMRGGDLVHGEDIAGGAVTGSTLTLMKEGLDEIFNTSPVELDHDLMHLNISATGKQRPGLVAMLAKHIAVEGGNVTHSKMVRLGQEFIIQMHVAIAPKQLQALLQTLEKSEELNKELNIQATTLKPRRYGTGHHKRAVVGIRIHCVGEDKPGMLASITQKVASKGMSVESLSTELRMGKDGRRDFVVDAFVSSNKLTDKENLNSVMKDITTLKDELGLDIMNLHVHTA